MAPTTAVGSGTSMIVIIILLIAAIYFFMIRPKTKKKQMNEMRSSVKDDNKEADFMNDLVKGKQLYEEAIENHYVTALYMPTIRYAEVFGGLTWKAKEAMRASADCGYPPALYEMALYYLFDDGHREAATKDISDKYEALEKQYLEERNDQQLAVHLLEQAGAQEYGPALAVLGDLYLYGRGSIEINQDQAFHSYLRGANLGDKDAMYMAGRCYYVGSGTNEDNATAFRWFCKARDAGSERMWMELGQCYWRGWGCEEDVPKAIEAFNTALDTSDTWNDDVVKFELALLYAGVGGWKYADLEYAKRIAESIPEDASNYANAQKLLSDFPKFEEEYREYLDQQKQSSSSSGGCYIATAVYGSYDCPEVWTLRRFRDETLAATWHGRAFVKTYYAISPTLVKLFGKTAWFNRFWRNKLTLFIEKLQHNGVESTPYEDRMW